MLKSEAQGMQTFDTALYNLYQSKKISLDEALRNADSKNNLRLRISLEEGGKNSAEALAAKPAEAAEPSAEQGTKEQPAEAPSAPPKTSLDSLSLQPIDEPEEDEVVDDGRVLFNK